MADDSIFDASSHSRSVADATLSALSWVHPGTIMVIPLEWGCSNNSAVSVNTTEPIASREHVIGCAWNLDAHPSGDLGGGVTNGTQPLVMHCMQSLTGEWLATPEQASTQALPASFVVPLLTKTVPLQGCVHNMKLKYYVGPRDADTATQILHNKSSPMAVRSQPTLLLTTLPLLQGGESSSRHFSLIQRGTTAPSNVCRRLWLLMQAGGPADVGPRGGATNTERSVAAAAAAAAAEKAASSPDDAPRAHDGQRNQGQRPVDRLRTGEARCWAMSTSRPRTVVYRSAALVLQSSSGYV